MGNHVLAISRVRMFKLFLLLALAGEDDLAGTYTFYDGPANFLDICQDQCAYKKDGGNAEDTYCFKTEGVTHTTECVETGSVSTPSGGSGSCPYSKDNLSSAEYQTKIDMPAGSSPPYDIVITFDADTTIGSCHSNCDDLTCAGSKCTVTYKGTIPMEMFNIKKPDNTGENDRSNMISVTINGVEQC